MTSGKAFDRLPHTYPDRVTIEKELRERIDAAVREAFGETLKAAREKKGISQEQLSYTALVDRTIISAAERGGGNPRLTTLVRLSRALDEPFNELVTRCNEVLTREEKRSKR